MVSGAMAFGASHSEVLPSFWFMVPMYEVRCEYHVWISHCYHLSVEGASNNSPTSNCADSPSDAAQKSGPGVILLCPTYILALLD